MNTVNSKKHFLEYHRDQHFYSYSLTFNIFVCDLVLNLRCIEIASCVGDTTPYFCGKNEDLILEKLELTTGEILL